MSDGPAAASPLIELAGVGHRFAEGGGGLAGISFQVRRGERLVVLGANGSGKTTLLRILGALLLSEQGAHVHAGRRIDRAALADRAFMRRFRREVVLLFQNPDAMLFNPTVRQEIAFGPRQLGLPDAAGQVRAWAERLAVAHLLDRPPYALSSGEKQRVCLAALLVLAPRVLLLDEPTANLDPRSIALLVDLLAELDVTSIIATHNLSLAPELGDRALVLSEEHRLVFDGPLEALLADEGTLAAANLAHGHIHRHGGGPPHRHAHRHDWRG
jgi:cobalt/nickel transport system ATP-binding protein